MHDGVGAAHDGDVAFPEHQIAALQPYHRRNVERSAKAVLLHVAVARQPMPAAFNAIWTRPSNRCEAALAAHR